MFSKVLSIVNLYSKYIWVLTFENLCQDLVRGFSLSQLRQLVLGPPGTVCVFTFRRETSSNTSFWYTFYTFCIYFKNIYTGALTFKNLWQLYRGFGFHGTIRYTLFLRVPNCLRICGSYDVDLMRGSGEFLDQVERNVQQALVKEDLQMELTNRQRQSAAMESDIQSLVTVLYT